VSDKSRPENEERDNVA